jgi:hypothetical protein
MENSPQPHPRLTTKLASGRSAAIGPGEASLEQDDFRLNRKGIPKISQR